MTLSFAISCPPSTTLLVQYVLSLVQRNRHGSYTVRLAFIRRREMI